MTNDNIVPMPNTALHPAPVIIDDSRLQTIWDRQHRRQNWIVGGCCATALLIAGALVVMAFRINAEPPKVEVAAPVINIPEQKAPVVNIAVPEQPAPVVNITVPHSVAAAPAVTPQPLRTGEAKIVTNFVKFYEVTVGQHEVITGWRFRDSTSTTPSEQWCFIHIDRTRRLYLGEDGKLTSNLATDARAVGIDPGLAEQLAKSCRWYNTSSTSSTSSTELRDPTR
jgi:hypothetical protein